MSRRPPVHPRPPARVRHQQMEAARQDDHSRLRAVPSILSGVPGGAEIGSFAHGVLEQVDFAAA